MDGIEPVVETMAQNWPSMGRKGNMNVLTAIRERVLSWAGRVARMDHKEICAKTLRCEVFNGGDGDSFTGKKSRKTNGLAHTHNGSKSTGGRTWLLGKCPKSLEMQTVCRNLSRTTSCSKLWKLETFFEIWKEPCMDGPRCLGDPCASGMTGTDAGAAWLTRRKT